MSEPRNPELPEGSLPDWSEDEWAEWASSDDTRAMVAIGNHFARHLGAPESTFHPLDPRGPHVDVHVIPPGPERPHWTLFTTGMSDAPMAVPEGCEDPPYAELMLLLPPEWDMAALAEAELAEDLPRWWWPIQWLQVLAGLPQAEATWLGIGHTIPCGDAPSTFDPTTQLCGWLLLPPTCLSPEARTVGLEDGRQVHLYVIIGLHRSEMDLKLRDGLRPLLEAFLAQGFEETLQPGRAPAV